MTRRSSNGKIVFRVNHAPVTSDRFRSIGLVDAPSPPALAAIVTLVALTSQVPASVVSIVQNDQDRQCVAAGYGLDNAWPACRQTGPIHSICKHVARTGLPVVIANIQESALARGNRPVADFGVVAYLGVPIHWIDGTTIGALCIMDTMPRPWTDMDRVRLEAFARWIDEQIRIMASGLPAD